MKSFRKEFTFSRIQYGVGDIRYSFHSSSHQSQPFWWLTFFSIRNKGKTHRFQDLNNGTWSELKLKIEVELDRIGTNIECVFVWATFLFLTINDPHLQSNYNYNSNLDACMCHIKEKNQFFLRLCFTVMRLAQFIPCHDYYQLVGISLFFVNCEVQRQTSFSVLNIEAEVNQQPISRAMNLLKQK